MNQRTERNKKIKKAVMITLSAVLSFFCLMTVVSCGSSTNTKVKGSFVKTTNSLVKEFEKMFDDNKVLKTLSDLSASAYQVSVNLPEELLADMVGTSLFPNKYVFSNDVKNKTMSLTTSMAGKKMGVYINDKSIAVDLLSKPIIVETKTAAKDILAWLEDNGVTGIDESIFDQFTFSYSGLVGTGDANKSIDNLKKTWDKLKLVSDLIDKSTCTELDDETLELQTKSVKTKVYKLSITEKDMNTWFKNSMDKIKDNDDINSILTLACTSAGMDINDMYDEIENSAEFWWIEDYYLQIYLYDGEIIQFEVYYDDDMVFSLAFLGDKNLTDKIVVSVPDSYYPVVITLEGNLIPVKDNVNYKISVKQGTGSSAYRSSVTLDWDLSASSGNNLTISGSDIDKYSMFFGLTDKKTVGLNFDIETYSYETWQSVTSRIKLVFEPLDSKISFPTDGVKLSSVDPYDLMAALEEIIGY